MDKAMEVKNITIHYQYRRYADVTSDKQLHGLNLLLALRHLSPTLYITRT